LSAGLKKNNGTTSRLSSPSLLSFWKNPKLHGICASRVVGQFLTINTLKLSIEGIGKQKKSLLFRLGRRACYCTFGIFPRFLPPYDDLSEHNITKLSKVDQTIHLIYQNVDLILFMQSTIEIYLLIVI
jgi:hypothetical protein